MTGKFFSASLTTVAGADLMTQVKSAAGLTAMNPKKVTIIADAALSVKINGVGTAYSPLFPDDEDDLWKLSLDGNDVLVSSIVTEENAVDLWIAIVF